MKAIVTGASGFLGSHLKKKLDEYIAIPHEQLVETNIPEFDTFFFLSSYGNLASQTDDYQIFKANIADLLHVLLQIRKYKIKSFVFISTSSVKLKHQTTYSRCKKAAEEILLSMMEKYDIPICIIRPFSITGIGEQSEHLIPVLLDAAYTGKEVQLAAEPTHDFIDVEDVVAGILNLSEHSARGVFELGTGKKVSNMEVLQLVEKVTKKKINVQFVSNMRPYDNADWVSTNFKSRSYGWLPKKSLEQSITEMYDDYRRGKEEN